jgi:hypothetical protein
MNSVETSSRNLSDFWWRDGSPDAARELVSILHGADMLIGNMGSDIRVTWSGDGMSSTDLEKRIVALDYGPLHSHPCPLPGTVVDEVIGYAVHEGGHCLWTSPAKKWTITEEIRHGWSSLPSDLQQDWQADQEGTLAEICRLQNILEDGYVDHQVDSKWPVLGEYIRIARNRLNERASIDLEAIARGAFPDRNSIINLWVSIGLYGHSLPPTVAPRVRRVLTPLLNLSERAKGEENGVIRQRMAVGAAAILWSEFPAGDVSKAQGHQSRAHSDDAPAASAAPGGSLRNLDDFDPRSAPGARGREVISVPKSLLDAVAGVLANQVEDLSNPVALVVGEDPRRLAAEARRAGYDPERARRVISVVQQQVREVQASFLNQQHRNFRWHHGLQRGKLDDRRLWKPLVGDPGYFKLKDLAGRPSLAVGLLLDVSGSVSRYMPLVEQTTAVFCQGLLPTPGIDFAAWWYTGQSGKMILTGICERRYPKLCLANVTQGGETPSGAAIAGVKVLMERMSGKQQLLIHFTDGRPDCPIHVRRAVQACRDAGIQVYAIGPARYRELLASEYGSGNYETIEAVSELPEAVASLVKKLGVRQR